jgi:hypothetical protein
MASLSTSRKPEPGAFRERRAVIVVDPLPVVRAGLSMLLPRRPGFEVIAGVRTAADAFPRWKASRPPASWSGSASRGRTTPTGSPRRSATASRTRP